MEPWPQVLSLVPFALDWNAYDSGGAFGRDAAMVLLTGQADPGAAVEACAVTAAGAPHTAWAKIATAAADGAWHGAARHRCRGRLTGCAWRCG